MNAQPDFTGRGLSFSVLGEGSSVDATTGVVSISSDTLRDGLEVIVTATSSGGSATSRFRVTIADITPAPNLSVPILIAAPTLSGTGIIGTEAVALLGLWEGVPEPVLTLRWQRNGVDIPGATEAIYVLKSEDDLGELACIITATNAEGSAEAITEFLQVRRAAPQAAGGLADLLLDQASGGHTVAAAGDFAGEGLSFTVSGAGALIDPASGVVSLPTDTVRNEEIVTVRATNSGGSATSAFRVTVKAIESVAAPEAVGRIGDVVLEQDSGLRTISTQAAFAGSDLIYALESAPEGVSILPGSGLVSISTAELLSQASVVVRARNAGGEAVQSFAVTVRSTLSVFDDAAKLAEVSFFSDRGAPTWSFEPEGFARLVPAAKGRAHGNWSKAAGDGLYRCLARWNSSVTTHLGSRPFSFSVRMAETDGDYTGLRIDAVQPSPGFNDLSANRYSGTGTTTTTLGTARVGWGWNVWTWLEVEVNGASVKARTYPETDTAPEWQLEVTTDHTEAGAFGPGGFPRYSTSPQIDIRRLEFHPLGHNQETAPAAPLDGNWSLGQFTELK